MNEIIKKGCSVVMLPTDEKSYIGQHKRAKLLVYTNKRSIEPLFQNQELFIVSEDKIKKDDWYLYYLIQDAPPEIMQCRDEEEAERCNDKSRSIGRISYKIEASTKQLVLDESEWYLRFSPKVLSTKEVEEAYQDFVKENVVPTPPKKFLERYCKSEGTIKNVLVEFEFKKPETKLNEDEEPYQDYPIGVKIGKRNTITMYVVEEEKFD